MAISRMDMERQLRNMGGLMTLEEPSQGYFLGQLVRKAKKAVKKVVKSPLGKAALIGGGLGLLGGAKFLGGQGIFAGGQGLGRFRNLANLIRPAATNVTGKRGLLSGLFYDKDGAFSLGRTALTGLTGAAVAAPFLMGGDEEELNRQNALGGYYSEAARSGRRRTARIENMLNRLALGKKISYKNLMELQAQEKKEQEIAEAAAKAMQDRNRAEGRGGYQAGYSSDFMEGPSGAGTGLGASDKGGSDSMCSFMDVGIVDLVDIYD